MINLFYNKKGLDDVGSTPYSLLKPALRKATPQQLLRIEKANPVKISCSFICVLYFFLKKKKKRKLIFFMYFIPLLFLALATRI